MSLSINKTAETVEFRNNSTGKSCAIYHYMDPYKSYFRGLYTPSGNDVAIYSRMAKFCRPGRSAASHRHPFLFEAKERKSGLSRIPRRVMRSS